MEIPWLTRLNTVDLQCSAEKDQMHYLAHDRVSGKIYKISDEIATAITYCKQLGPSADAREADKEHLKVAFGFLGSLQQLHKSELSRRPPFNPLFINFEVFDVGPFQPSLKSLARFWVGPVYWAVLATLTIVAFWLGGWSDWQILEVFKNVFSISAIATFALVAPFLKILHELGHTLAATRFGVRVRKAGLYLVGLYPMPYVDCTNADLSATRKQRIVISLAGLFVDLVGALVAFIAWHFVEGSFLKTLLGNIFMFSSINSVAFNANPLIKLDGYYALADALGMRNMYTDASGIFRKLRRKIMTFGKDGFFPATKRERALALYAFASVLYKINIILTILWMMLPKYFGMGTILALWGMYMMFFAPMMSAESKPSQSKGGTMRFWLLVLVASVALLGFVRAPFRVVMPMAVDIENHYSIQTKSAGFIDFRASEGMVEAGDVLLTLHNPDLVIQRDLQANQLEIAQYALDAISGSDPAGAIVAEEQLHAAETRFALASTRIENLTILAGYDGYFSPDYAQRQGDFVLDGATYGALYPQAGQAILIGDFLERYVEKFQNTHPKVELRLNGTHLSEERVLRVDLVQTTSFNLETGERSYQLSMPIVANPAVVNGANIYAKILFPREALYRHVQFFIAGLVQKFREAKLTQN